MVGSRLIILASIAVGIAAAIIDLPTPVAAKTHGPVRYDRDIRPILSDRCFTCHGPDAAKRKSELRLDDEGDSTRARPDGAAIVPGNARASAMFRRVESSDPDLQMPPPSDTTHALAKDEIANIQRWIDEGAIRESHWSFVTATRPAAPAPQSSAWCANDIDRFILAGLDAESLTPSPATDRATLVRRLFLDLTGLPPTAEETAAFVADTAADSTQRLIDRLLSEEPYRTRYAQRMAVPWLDIARYADTSGLHTDAGRANWLWRDWVIEAMRSHMPYDQFVIEQMAGDLLPNPSQEQLIASGFHRNHVTSDEGGAINEEYLLEYAVDRVTTTGAAFLGLSIQCARCHDHKFDPVTMNDFYGMIAFFNSIEEPGVYSQIPDPKRSFEPAIAVAQPGQTEAIASLAAEIADLTTRRDERTPDEDAQFQAYATGIGGPEGIQWLPTTTVAAASKRQATPTIAADGSVLIEGENPDTDQHTITLETPASAIRMIALEALPIAARGDNRIGRAPNGNAILDSISAEAISVKDESVRTPITLDWAWADIEQPNGDYRAVNALTARDGREWAPNSHMDAGGRVLLFASTTPFGFEGGTRVRITLGYDSEYAKHILGHVRLTLGSASDALMARLPVASSSWYLAGPWQTVGGESEYDLTRGPESMTQFDRTQSWGEYSWRFAPLLVEAQTVGLAQGPGSEFAARQVFAPSARTVDLALGSDDGIVVYLNGEKVLERKIDRPVAANQERLTLNLRAGENSLLCKIVNTGGPGGIYHRQEEASGVLPKPLVPVVLAASMGRPELRASMRDTWRATTLPRVVELSAALAAKEAERTKIAAAVPQSMVMKEREMPRETFVHMRGAYDQPDKTRPVQRAVPVALGMLRDDAPRNRLGLAQWLVSKDNPLTARVAMNRLWGQFFGRGLVRSEDDFGLRGEWPTHPELLDYLAAEFVESGWSVEHMVRLITSSATYAQSSALRTDLSERDPENRLLGRFPRQRLSAEQIRDQALYVSGLLKEQTKGESVKTYQPSGLWEEVSMPASNTRTHVRGMGDDLWRRSLYTYWKRAVPPPSLLTFDAPTREYCVTRRMTTNTPLQALVLWNDEQFVEAARATAARVLSTPGDDRERVGRLFALCTGALPAPALAADLVRALEASRARYQNAPDEAALVAEAGESPVAVGLEPREIAAWTLLASSILSSDATIVKD